MKKPLCVFLAALALAGCQSEERPLKVALVDTVRVVEERPEVSDIRLDWAKEASEFYLRLDQVTNKEEFALLKSDINKRSEKWREDMQKFVADSVTAVESATQEVAKQKGIDIVVAGNRYVNTIQYFNGEDITVDVLLKMEN